jgi:hypothetical protein
MFKQWVKAVFWSTTAKSFWTFGSIVSAAFCLTPIASRFPLLRFIVPLGLFTVSFFVSSCLEYLSLAQRLEQLTGALTLSNLQTIAGEILSLSSKRHTIVVDIYLSARNQSGEGNSIHVQTCSVDIPAASLEYLQFIQDAQDNIYRRPSDVFGIEPKSERKPVVRAVFTLPESPFPIPQDNVTGILKIIDIHDRKREIKYTAVLERNTPTM